MPLALPEIVRIVGAEVAYLYLSVAGSERLVLKSARDAEGREVDERSASLEVVEQVRLSREPLMVSGYAGVELGGEEVAPRHVVGAPLLLGHRFFGVIYLERGLARGGFTGDDIEILSAIADHLALALDTARMERLERRARGLARSKEAALDATRAKSAFIAHMSHELRTPLSAIIGYSELLEEELQDVAEARGFVPDMRKIQAAANHLLALINNMLDLSKIEAGKMELHLEEFELGEVIEEAVSTVRPLIERGGNRLVVRGGEGGLVRLDRVKVRQVLLNLLGNAAKFTKEGEVVLQASRTYGEPGERVLLQVSDTGIGMSAGQIKRIFQEFAQGSAATTQHYGGTGLGLAISRGFCRLMRGEIEVESALGEGTTFTVKLPVRLSEADLEDSISRSDELDGVDGVDDVLDELPGRSGVYPWTI